MIRVLSILIDPLVGDSIPYMEFNKVDLPQPDLPHIHVKPRDAMSKLISLSTFTERDLDRNDTFRWRIEIKDTL